MESRTARASRLGRWVTPARPWYWPCLAAAILVFSGPHRVVARLPAAQVSNTQPFSASAVSTGGADAKLQQAREALTGKHKDTVLAKKLLLEIVEHTKTELGPSDLCHVYVYLGYIEDRAGHRTEATPWYRRAAEIQEAGVWIRQCALAGLEKPLTWIRHLEEGTAPEGSSPAPKTLRPAKGYVITDQPPTGPVPAKMLSPEERRENFNFLCEAIDTTYAGFQIKALNWPDICRRYRERLAQAATADDFYRLLFGLINELKDTHSWLQNYQPSLPAHGPGVTVQLFGAQPFVVAVEPGSDAAAAGLQPGAAILEVERVTVEEKIDRLRSLLPGRSSERAFRRETARYLLAGDKGTTVNVKWRSPDGQRSSVETLKRSFSLASQPARTHPFPVTRQWFVHFGRHPSGLGYVWIETFNGRQEIGQELDRALEALRATPGLIIDIRNNPGGFGTAQPHIVGRFITNRTLVAISYIKHGPGHQDLEKHEEYFEPSGSWQYTSPVALLVDDLTGSAADLFACYMRSAGRVVTLGSTTHGNLSGVAAYAVLPCGLIVRISNGYVCDAKNRPIEGNGNEPDISVSPTIDDLLNDRDPVLNRAVTVLAEKSAEKRRSN